MKYTLLLVIILLISSSPVYAQYKGGSNDGYSLLQAKGFQNVLPAIYAGGANDGYATASTPNQNGTPGIYFGGSNDGYAALQAKGMQNVMPGIYAGGASDGFSIAGTATQNLLPGIYSGGNNDGYAWAIAASQNTTPPIYFGGANDGVDMADDRILQNTLPEIYVGGAGVYGYADDGYAFAVSLNQNATELPPRDRDRTAPLLQLSGEWFNNDAVLAWKIDAGNDLDHFELQRSEHAGADFSSIVSIDPNPEQGQNEYRFTDIGAYQVPADFLLYRLKCIDKQGSFKYSAVVRLTKDKTAPVIVAYPNPTSGRFTLALLNVKDLTGYGYVLSSTDGKMLKRGNIQDASTSFDLSGYASATYHLFLFKDGKPVQHFTILLTQ